MTAQQSEERRLTPDGQTDVVTLRELRRRRYWTQADLALAFEERSRQVGRALSLSVRQVRRWEGADPPLPLPAYQEVLESLFGLPIERMGFPAPWPGSPRRELGEDAGPTPGGASAARSYHDDRERADPVKRRQFVAGAVALGSGASVWPEAARSSAAVRTGAELGPAPAGALGFAARRAALDPQAVSGYAAITGQHRSLYWTVPAETMIEPVRAHAELGTQLLGSAGSGMLRARLAGPVAETALLAARLYFFDVRRPEWATAYFDTARQAAREAGDPALLSAVLAHAAFPPAFAGVAGQARALIRQALEVGLRGASPEQRSWLYAVQSEVEARLGDGRAATDAIARAEAELGRGGPARPDWLDFYDASRLTGFSGFCQLAAGRPSRAAETLEHNLRGLTPTAAKQRSITLADLAGARARQGEYEESARLLEAAVDQLGRHWYATGLDRVDAVRRRLIEGGAPSRVLASLTEARSTLAVA
jgi:tetratricopeptide (TPR) repeat protein/transcriptional regulator with XRE-family HTH domain